MGHPFEQQPKESNKAFAAFSAYLGMGSERSTQAVAKQLAKSEQLVRRWSARWRWTERVRAHGGHIAMVERQATEALVRGKAAEWLTRQEDHREEEWELRGELITAGRKVLEKFKDGSRGATLGDVARALELASKLGRMASGLVTDKTEFTGEVDVNFRLDVEAAIKKVYGDVIDVETVKETNHELD